MIISEILALSKKQLETKGVRNAKLDSLILLSHALSFSKEQIIFNPNFELNKQQETNFLDLINRRCKREPVSHLIEKREFYGRDFTVNQDVLDPRPDSETLIELVLKNFPDKKQNIEILEIGCGSGCLVITLLKELENAFAYGVDISKKALAISQKNARNNEVSNRLTLIESDLFSKINDEKFDLIISNPPYIPSQDIEELEAEVRIFEPRIALDGGIDGLDFYHKIAAHAPSFLNKNGKIILEIGINQEQDVIAIFTSQNFKFIESKKDLAGIVRVLHFEV